MPKSTFDKKKEQISAEVDKIVDDAKDTAEDIWNRWSKSKTEAKWTMIIWIILLIRALYALRDILPWVILLILGLLSVSWFFDRPLKDLISYCKKEFKSK